MGPKELSVVIKFGLRDLLKDSEIYIKSIKLRCLTEHHFLNMKQYAIFAKNRKTGEIFGYVEHSFFMNLRSEYVRVWDWAGAKYHYNQLITNQVCVSSSIAIVRHGKLKVKDYEFFIVRLDSAACRAKFTLVKENKAGIFYKRNYHFTLINK